MCVHYPALISKVNYGSFGQKRADFCSFLVKQIWYSDANFPSINQKAHLSNLEKNGKVLKKLQFCYD